MDMLFSRSKICFKSLKKLPKTILIVDAYNTITDDEKERIRNASVGIKVDFEEKTTHYSLIILCNIVLRFNLTNPLTLAEGEIWFTRRRFSERTFMDALRYYSECEIRNGV